MIFPTTISIHFIICLGMRYCYRFWRITLPCHFFFLDMYARWRYRMRASNTCAYVNTYDFLFRLNFWCGRLHMHPKFRCQYIQFPNDHLLFNYSIRNLTRRYNNMLSMWPKVWASFSVAIIQFAILLLNAPIRFE